MSQPIFTIITPTMGNRSLLKLKESLKYETTPFIHIIIWDLHRVEENALKPEEVEDSRTFSYVMRHPYFEMPNQRNDIHLRSLGIQMTNTPFVTWKDDDVTVEPDHLVKIFSYMTRNKLDYTYCKRRMLEPSGAVIGVDNFESTGEPTKFGYTLIDNSSLYVRLETARRLSLNFMNHEIYGDDRYTKEFMDSIKARGSCMPEVLVNHTAKATLVDFFKLNIQ
jgi:hypothetical protein